MTVLQSLDDYYGRMAERGDVVPPGWSLEPIGLVLVIAPDGSVVDAIRRYDATGKRPKPERVPKWFGRSGQGSTPNFLWDNTAYALGVSAKEGGKTARDHDAFKALHADAFAEETDPGLVAVKSFLAKWRPEMFAQPPFDEKMLTLNVAFRLQGDDGLIHERAAARRHVERLREASAGEATAPCLVRGAVLPVVRLHPKIKGVDGTASAEVPLVSFNEPAFESYGKEQGANAPTSQEAAARYAAALNALLDRGASRNRLKIGDATVVFWADASEVGEAAAHAAEDVFAAALGLAAAAGDDAHGSAKLHDALTDLAQGRPARRAEILVTPGTRFHVLGLAPNAARLSVRFWLSDSLGAFAERLAAHFADLAIDPAPWRSPPSIQRLLVKTVAMMEKFDNIPPLLAGEMTRAVLGGGRYPRTLMTAALMRLRAGDDPAAGWHAAALKACLARDERLKLEKGKTPVSLDRDDPNPAYQLGRLFAALETAQRMALGPVNATIRDRYYAAASATPAGVFPLLLRGAQNHLGKLRKDFKGGWLEREIEAIFHQLPGGLPRTLRLEAQGRFAIGYYHQRRAQFSGHQAEIDKAEDENND